jgi:TonB family protein
VQQVVDKASPDIREALSGVVSLYDKRDTVSLKFYITPGGALDLIGFVEAVTVDSDVMKDLAASINRQVMDPIDKRTFTKIIIRSYLDENSAVALSDKVETDYVEIRSLTDILIIVNMNSGNIVRAYSKRWAEKTNLEGVVTVKFGIDDKGDVVSAGVASSTVNDLPLEEAVLKNVRSWKFGEIYNPGDVTEVMYPFKFSQ